MKTGWMELLSFLLYKCRSLNLVEGRNSSTLARGVFGVFTSNAFVNFMTTISTEDYKHSVVLVLAVVRRTKHSELCTSHRRPRKWGALIRK